MRRLGIKILVVAAITLFMCGTASAAIVWVDCKAAQVMMGNCNTCAVYVQMDRAETDGQNWPNTTSTKRWVHCGYTAGTNDQVRNPYLAMLLTGLSLDKTFTIGLTDTEVNDPAATPKIQALYVVK